MNTLANQWVAEQEHKSMENVHGSIPFPHGASFLKKLLAFSGPGYLIAVGYMDPGNWATDIAGGSKFGYTLLSVIVLSSIAAMILQYLSAKLGIATGRDLAQACREDYPRPVSFVLWLLAEVAIVACDIAEVIGSAIALHLIFDIPLAIGTIITAVDVFIILLLQKHGFRFIEAFVMALIGTILISFGLEIILSHASASLFVANLLPNPNIVRNPEMLYIGLGILGATVMPHNLYLHSAIVQTRSFGASEKDKSEAIKFAGIDSTMALLIAFFVNAAILVVSAAVFWTKGYHQVVEIQDAYKLLTPLLGTSLASIVFALALLASGQNSTITGTMAGQVIMEGFIHLKIAPWVRRLITRSLAIIPAVIIVVLYQEHGLAQLLIFSQVVLGFQLSFAVFPLVMMTSSKKKMGNHVNSLWLTVVAFFIAIAIALLNGWLILSTVFR